MHFSNKVQSNFSIHLVIKNLFLFLCLNIDGKFYILYCSKTIIDYMPKVLGSFFLKFAMRLTT